MMVAVPVRRCARCLNLVCVIMTKYNKNCQHDMLVVFIPAGNEPSGCVSIHLANAARVKYPAALQRGI